MENKLPKVSFVIPTYNAGDKLETCLKSITNQNYPADLIEIIISDGGSTDNTIKIAEKYRCKIIYNKYKLAEPGVFLGTEKARGEILFILAADNELTSKKWVSLMVKPFERSEVYSVVTHLVSKKSDHLLNKYINLIHADPFSYFVYKDACNPKKFQKIYKVIFNSGEYAVLDIPLINFPLIALAQGTGIRKKFKRKKETMYDDIIPILNLIESGKKVAYVKNAGIYHEHIVSLRQFIKKYEKRIFTALNNTTYGFRSRTKYLSKERKIRQYLWFIYSLSFIWPLFESITNYKRDKNLIWLLHPFVCFLFSLIIIKTFFTLGIKKIFNRFTNILNLLNV